MSDINRLIEIMAALRTPGTGCPWDLEQDFASIAQYTVEEAYEVVDAITRGDLDATVFLRHRSTRQVFDEGDRATVDAIGLLRESANDAIQRNPRMRLLLNLKGDVTEGRSDASPELQAADVAAGYARRLYESEDGLKNVCVEFRQVLLNGTLVRDCQQQPCVG